jgi:hypothetical protein
MSRYCVGKHKDDFLKWLKKHCKADQYEIVLTDFDEIIICPTKSTKSLRYVYVELFNCWDSEEKALKDIKKNIDGVDIIRMRKFDWDSTKSPSIKQSA